MRGGGCGRRWCSFSAAWLLMWGVALTGASHSKLAMSNIPDSMLLLPMPPLISPLTIQGLLVAPMTTMRCPLLLSMPSHICMNSVFT